MPGCLSDEFGRRASGGPPAGGGAEPSCRICGCTEAAACPGGCSWIDPTQTLCSGCAHLIEPLTALAERMVSACCDLAGDRVTGGAVAAWRTCQDALIELERALDPGDLIDEEHPPPALLVVADRVCAELESYAGVRPNPKRAYRLACDLRRRITGHAGGSPLQRAANAARKRPTAKAAKSAKTAKGTADLDAALGGDVAAMRRVLGAQGGEA